MATNKITALEFKNLKAGAKDQLISDGDSLFISIRSESNGGSKSFRMAYRINGKQSWITLKALTLSNARIERDEIKETVRQGKDPSLERSLKLERERQQQLDEQAAITKLQARITVNDLFVRWFDTDLINRKDRAEVLRMFNKDVLPVLGSLLVEDVRKGHITQVTDALLVRGVAHLARNILKLIRQMFRFAVDRDVIEFDPTASLRITKITTTPTERDRTLSDVEIRALARQLPDAHLLISTECAVWIALSTMCRIGELSKAKFSDLDFDLKTWTIPKESSKNGKAHTIYLSDFALEQFKVLTNVASHNIWLFPNRDGSSHVCEKSITKQVGGRQSDNILSNRSKHNQALVLTGGKWTPHDLRRTGATIMGDLGIAPDVTEKCLNHTEENKVKRIYQRQKLEVEQAEAWQVLGDRLALLINMDDSNVVLLHKCI
jgi:integrase